MRRPVSLAINVDIYEAENNKNSKRVYDRNQQDLPSKTNTDKDVQLILDVDRIDRPKAVAPPIVNPVHIGHSGAAGRRSEDSEKKKKL